MMRWVSGLFILVIVFLSSSSSEVTGQANQSCQYGCYLYTLYNDGTNDWNTLGVQVCITTANQAPFNPPLAGCNGITDIFGVCKTSKQIQIKATPPCRCCRGVVGGIAQNFSASGCKTTGNSIMVMLDTECGNPAP
jgi:hypothetical protein